MMRGVLVQRSGAPRLPSVSSPGAAVTAVLRRAILAAAESSTIRRFVRRHGMRLGAARFVAGETLDQAVPVLRRLNEQGLLTNTTFLGEDVRDEAETRAVVDVYVCVLERIRAEGLRTNVALKLTHLGLALDEELAYSNVAAVVDRAAKLGNFIRIDMEASASVDATLRIYRRLREAGRENVRTVLQSYLHRSERDLESSLDPSPNLRFVKGAYRESSEVAYSAKRDVDAAYVRLVERAFGAEGFTAVATHVERLIEHAIRFAERKAISTERFQLQMLYGVRPKLQLQLELAARGYEVLVATPYGPDWYRYLMRRLAERPANVLFLLRNLVRR
jgi:proline dehydrogenase